MAQQLIIESQEWAPKSSLFLDPSAILGASDNHWFSALDGPELVGIIGYVGLNPVDRSADVALGVVPKYRGQGWAHDLALAQNDYAFNDLGLTRLQMVALSDSPSCVIARSAGLQLEGTLRNCRYKRGRMVDASVYALVKEED